MIKKVALLVLLLLLPTKALAQENNYPNYINWTLLEIWTYQYDYVWLEESDQVKWLQYWLEVNVDGVYGPTTNKAHRQKAMEIGIQVPLHDYVIQDRYFGDAVEQYRPIVVEALARYGKLEDVPKFLSVMLCESGGDTNAYNAASGASGLMQHLSVYWDWRAKMAGYEGYSPFDAEANIFTSSWLLYEHTNGGWQHWVCQ
tara:strand:+ start:1597 stop:2196 length:600 start_codon:yes stop_codon:yes gene_type:complete